MTLVGLLRNQEEFSWRNVGCNDDQDLLDQHLEMLDDEISELPSGRCKNLIAAALMRDPSTRSTAKDLIKFNVASAEIRARAVSTGASATEVDDDDEDDEDDDDAEDVLIHTPLSIWNRRIKIDTLSPGTTIWHCHRPEERCKWAKELNQLKTAANVLKHDMFAPAQLVTASRKQIEAKLNAMRSPNGEKTKVAHRRNILAQLRTQGHGFYYPARHAVERNHMHTLGTLSFESILGQGSFGEVCRVRDRHTRKSYALKICAMTHQQKKEYGLKFVSTRDAVEAEVKTMKRVGSKSVLTALASGELPELGLFWTLSELCLGGALDERVKAQTISSKGVFKERVAWRWMKECISGLGHMHAACVMHNDLKPEVAPRDDHKVGSSTS